MSCQERHGASAEHFWCRGWSLSQRSKRCRDGLLLPSPIIHAPSPLLPFPDALALFQTLRYSKLFPTSVLLTWDSLCWNASQEAGSFSSPLSPPQRGFSDYPIQKSHPSLSHFSISLFISVRVNFCYGINHAKISTNVNKRYWFLTCILRKFIFHLHPMRPVGQVQLRRAQENPI